MESLRLKPIQLFLSLAGTLASACFPRGDLDAAATGKPVHTQATPGQSGATQGTQTVADRGGAGGQTTINDPETRTGGRTASGGTASSVNPLTSGGVPVTRSSTAPQDGLPTSGTTTRSANGGSYATSGATLPTGGGTTSTTTGGGVTGGSPPTTTSTSSGGIAQDLEELTNSPVDGAISVSSTANWDIYGEQQEAFRIQTPTATYFVVKSVAAIASVADENGVLWLNFSWAFVPNRGIPNLGGCCQLVQPSGSNQPVMTTVLDTQSETSTHVRLVSKPKDESETYWLVWDFFLTHMTLTVNRAKDPYGFTFDGVPGNVLEETDQLVLSTDVSQKATTTFSGDLKGPAEWAYLTNEGESKPGSLYLIQHADDSLKERYSVTDASGTKGSRFVFGDGQITATPLRFSLGLIGTVDAATVKERINYVIANTPP